MILNYYKMDKFGQVWVSQPCPGCGQMGGLVCHDEIMSHLKGRIKFWIGCNCGWRGPDHDEPIQAAAAWDLRAVRKCR